MHIIYLVQILFAERYKKKGKGKVRKWGPFRHVSHMAFCTLTPKDFLHSSLEALHAERRQRPQLAKEGTMNEFCWQSSNSHRLLGTFTCRKVGT
jgi:hypothetical protein